MEAQRMFHFILASWKWKSSVSYRSRCAVNIKDFRQWFTLGRTVCRAALLHVRKSFNQLPLYACFGTGSLCPSYTHWLMGTRSYGLRSCASVSVCLSLCVCVLSKQLSDRSRDPPPPTPAITSTGLFLPVGWFLPLRSLHFLHTHISLQQPYLFLNLAQVLWTPWTSNNSSSISLSICLWLSLSSFFLTAFFAAFFSASSIHFSSHFPR